MSLIAEDILFGDDNQLSRIEAGFEREDAGRDLVTSQGLDGAQIVHKLDLLQTMLIQYLYQPVAGALAPRGHQNLLACGALVSNVPDHTVENIRILLRALFNERTPAMCTGMYDGPPRNEGCIERREIDTHARGYGRQLRPVLASDRARPAPQACRVSASPGSLPSD